MGPHQADGRGDDQRVPQCSVLGRVVTGRAERYLEQFCSHGHKVHRMNHHGGGPRVSVRRDGHRAVLDFGRARCTLDAESDALVLHVEADNTDTLARIQSLLVANLARFGHRERLAVAWQPT